MPQIPVYNGQQVRTNELRTVNQQAPDVSSGLRAVGQGLGALGEVADKIVQRDVEAEALGAQAGILEKFNAWKAEEQNKARGINAKGHTARVSEWWDKAKAEDFGKLSPLAQRASARALSTARLSALEAANGYESQQLDVAARTALDDSTYMLANQAIAAGPARAAPLIEQATANIRAFGAQRGIDVEKQVLAVQTGVHANIIAQLQKVNPAEAANYFTAHKGQIEASRHDEIQKGLDMAGAQRKAQAFGDEIMAMPGVTLEAALAEARKRFEGDDETNALAEIKTRFQEREAGETLAAKKLAKTGWSSLLSVGSISRMDPKLVSDLRERAPEELRQMQDWLDTKRRQAKAEAEGNSDPNEFGRFYTYFRMAIDAPAKFADLDLTKVQPYVSKQQLAALVSMQSGISKTDAKAMALQNQVKQTLTMVDSTIRAAGLNPRAKPDSPAAKEFDNFMGAVTMALTQAQAERKDGSPLPPEEMRKIGMRLLQEGYEQGSGIFGMFQTTRRGYQVMTDPALADKDFITVPYGKIPQKIRDELTTAARNKIGKGSIYGNAAEVEAAVERAYQRGLDEGRFK